MMNIAAVTEPTRCGHRVLGGIQMLRRSSLPPARDWSRVMRWTGGGGYLYIGDIERFAGADAAELAQRCLDNTYGEIAVVNNSDSAIGKA
jgi:hypothetical protein